MKPGDRVRYHGWRGDDGEGTLIGFVRRGVVMQRAPSDWGERRDAVRVQRDFDAGGPTDFRPFTGEGERVDPIVGVQ